MKKLLLSALVSSLVLSLAAAEYAMKFTTDKKSAIYRCNENITMTAQLLLDGKAAVGCKAEVTLFKNGKAVQSEKFIVSEKPFTVTTKLEQPGWTHIYCKFADAYGKTLKHKIKWRGKVTNAPLNGGIGAMAEPEKITSPLPEPEDFDAFWDKVKKEALAHPMDVLEKIDITPEKLKDKFTVYDMKISCAGGKPVSGYLVIPKNAVPKSLPLHVSYHGAGFRSATMQLSAAQRGMITFDVNAHGIPNGKSKEFYESVRKETNRICGGRYNHSNKDNRDKYFYHSVYMRVLRSLQYVKSLPEWDGKNLVVVGGSQGGAQALIACALDHDVTLTRASVPALSDHGGSIAGRQSGWPRVYEAVDGKYDPAVAKTMSYYDNVFFARRIKCPIYICTGFIDTVCSPTSVYAVYNNIPAGTFKSMCITPTAAHTASDRYFSKALDKCMKAIKKGNGK